eukprot:8890964-Lingulodinium_polyedra.AAC.1
MKVMMKMMKIMTKMHTINRIENQSFINRSGNRSGCLYHSQQQELAIATNRSGFAPLRWPRTRTAARDRVRTMWFHS